MSLTGALSSAISALNAQSQSLAMVSDNIANADTTGYKTTSAMFEQLVTASSSSKAYSSGGVSVSGRANITQQGLLAATTNRHRRRDPGLRLFRLHQLLAAGGDHLLYPQRRFHDRQCRLSREQRLLSRGLAHRCDGTIIGTRARAGHDQHTVAPTNGSATTKTSIAANLPADAATGATFSSSMTVVRLAGYAHTLEINWTKTARPMTGPRALATANASEFEIRRPDNDGYCIRSTFNTDGSLNESKSRRRISLTGTGPTARRPARSRSISVRWRRHRRTDPATHRASTTPTSATSRQFGRLLVRELSSISIGKDGVVDATYSNGQTVCDLQDCGRDLHRSQRSVRAQRRHVHRDRNLRQRHAADVGARTAPARCTAASWNRARPTRAVSSAT